MAAKGRTAPTSELLKLRHSLVWCDRPDEAREVLIVGDDLPTAYAWEQEVAERLHHFDDLLASSVPEARRQLERWRDETIAHLGLPYYHDAYPELDRPIQARLTGRHGHVISHGQMFGRIPRRSCGTQVFRPSLIGAGRPQEHAV